MKALDPQHNTWLVWSDDYDHPYSDAVQFTCPSDEREVDSVTSADEDNSSATVKCK